MPLVSIATRIGSLIVAAWSGTKPRLLLDADRLDAHCQCPSASEDPQRDHIARPHAVERVVECRDRRCRRAVDVHDHVHRLEVARRVRAGDQLRDDDPGRLHHDVVAEVPKGDGGGDALREGHRLQLCRLRLRRSRTRSDDLAGRHERAVRVDPREEVLELARAALHDVDEVERPGLRGSGTLHLHEWRDRVRDVREEDELPRRDAEENHDGHGEKDDDPADHTPGCEVAPQNRNRFSPPSTTRVWPVT
jgi:hypothetical protein